MGPLKSIFSTFQMIWSKKKKFFFLVQKNFWTCKIFQKNEKIFFFRKCQETSKNCPAGLETSRNCPAGLGNVQKLPRRVRNVQKLPRRVRKRPKTAPQG